jgi:hypothetical protein
MRGDFGPGRLTTLDKGDEIPVALGKNNGLIAGDHGWDPGCPALDRQELHLPPWIEAVMRKSIT